MTTRRIQVPSPITLTDRMTGQKGQVIGIFDWACLAWFNDQRWHANMARLIAIVAKFEAARDGATTIDLVDDDWRILCEVVKQPAPAPPASLPQPLIGIQMESYKVAVLDAKAVDA